MATITDTWDSSFEATPAGSDLMSTVDNRIRSLKRATSERGRREHYWTPGTDNSKHGLHREGSARIFYGTSEPTTRPDGDALDSDDEGRLWYNGSTGFLNIYTGSEFILASKNIVDFPTVTDLTVEHLTVPDITVEHVDISSAADIGEILPNTSGTGLFTLGTAASGDTMTLPQGVYWIYAPSVSGLTVSIQVRVSTPWISVGSIRDTAMLVASDGTNVRIYWTLLSGSATAYYRKL